MPRLETPKRIGNASPSTSGPEHCSICNVRYVKEISMKKHMRQAHPEALAAPPAPVPAKVSAPVSAVAANKQSGTGDSDEWVSCGACSLAVRTRGELIRHVERRHIRASALEQEVLRIVGVSRDEANLAKGALKQTSKGCQWVEHMYIDRTVQRCKGLVGRTYVQSIGGQPTKVQKICPATVIVEPNEGSYEVLAYWRHVGHESAPLALSAGLARRAVPSRGQLCEEVRARLQLALTRLHLVSDDVLSSIVQKSKEMESLVKDLENLLEPIEQVLLPSLEPDAKPKADHKSEHKPDHKSEADRAVDDALQKYIKAKNPVIKLKPLEQVMAPKIVSAFSLKEEEELDNFVKDMELLVNNGRSFEAAEIRSRLGRAERGRKAKSDKSEAKSDKSEEKSDKSEEKSDKSEEKSDKSEVKSNNSEVKGDELQERDGRVKSEPPEEVKSAGIASRTRRHDDKPAPSAKKPEPWSRSNFNDTFKDFLSKEFKYQDPPKAEVKKPLAPVKQEKKRSLGSLTSEEDKLEDPEIRFTTLRMRSSTPKDAPEAKRRKTIHVDGTDGRTPIVTVSAPLVDVEPTNAAKDPKNFAVGVKSAASEPKNIAIGPKSAESESKNAVSTPKNIASGTKNAASTPKNIAAGPKSAASTPKNIASGPKSAAKSVYIGRKVTRSALKGAPSGPMKAHSGLDSAEREPKSAERVPKTAERGPKSAERGPKIAEKGPKSAERGPKSAEMGPKSAERGPKSAEVGPKSAESSPKSAISFSSTPKSRRLTTGSISEPKAKTRTGLLTKRPTFKPKTKFKVNMNFAAKLEARKGKSVSFERTDASEMDSSLERECTRIVDVVKKQEYIVKEQDNDVNILIIRM